MAVSSFSRRRLPDLLTEELVFVLSQKRSYEFKQLFEVVHDNLRRRKAASGGQEILRLRAYDKLQKLVFSGAVKKSGKIYTGNFCCLGHDGGECPQSWPDQARRLKFPAIFGVKEQPGRSVGEDCQETE